MMIFKKFLTLTTLILALTGCGFHLRGAVNLPTELNPIYINSDEPYAPFEQKLRDNLQASHIQIVDSPSSNTATLKILNHSLTTTLISISGNTLTSQYNVTYAITYEVRDKNNNIIIPSNTIQSANTYSANNAQMLGASNQQEALIQTLRNNTVFLLMTRLGSKQVREIFETNKTAHAQ